MNGLALAGRWLGRTALLCAALVGLLWVKAVAEARFELARAAQSDDPVAQIEHLALAVRWMAPVNPYADDALAQLLQHAQTQHRAGDLASAKRVYRAARGSLVASAGVVQLRRRSLEVVDRELAALGAPREAFGPSPEEKHAPTAAPLLRTLTLLGFAVWVAAAFGLAQLGDRRAPRARLACAAALTLGLSGFFVGLWWS